MALDDFKQLGKPGISISTPPLATDTILQILLNVSAGLVVYSSVVGNQLEIELPFIAARFVLMSATSAAGAHQDLHEALPGRAWPIGS